MELIINQKILSQALNKIRTVVERKSINEVLNHILLETVTDNHLLIRATDNEIMVPQYIQTIKIVTSGSAVVPAHLLCDIVKKAPENCELTLKTDTNVLKINFKKAKFSLNMLVSGNFPSVNIQQQFAVQISINTEHFIDVMNKIKCAISTDEIRYYLNGVFMHLDNQSSLVLVATDAHKLAQHLIRDIQITASEDCNPLDKGIIIPRKTISELHKFIDNSISILTIKINKNNIQFEQSNNAILYSSLIDGIFPDYQNILSTDCTKCKSLTIPYTKDLVDAINRVSVLSGDSTRRIVIKLGKNSMEISVVDIQSGSACEVLDVNYESEALSIVFNANYLSSILDNFPGMTEMHITSDTAPVIINNPSYQDLVYVLMPMHNLN